MFICSQWVTLLHFWTLSLKENQKCELLVIKDQQHLFPSMLLRQTTSDKLVFTTLQRRSTCSKRWEECTDPQQCTALEKRHVYWRPTSLSYSANFIFIYFLRTLRLVFHITLALFLFFSFVCLLHFLIMPDLQLTLILRFFPLKFTINFICIYSFFPFFNLHLFSQKLAPRLSCKLAVLYVKLPLNSRVVLSIFHWAIFQSLLFFSSKICRPPLFFSCKFTIFLVSVMCWYRFTHVIVFARSNFLSL